MYIESHFSYIRLYFMTKQTFLDYVDNKKGSILLSDVSVYNKIIPTIHNNSNHNETNILL